MKKLSLLIFLITFGLTAQQNESSKIIESELNINLFSLLIFESLEVPLITDFIV